MHRGPQRRAAHQISRRRRAPRPAGGRCRCRATPTRRRPPCPGPPPTPPPPSPPSASSGWATSQVLSAQASGAADQAASARLPTASRKAAAIAQRRDRRLVGAGSGCGRGRRLAPARPARRPRLQQRQAARRPRYRARPAGADRSAAGPGNPCSSRCGRDDRARRGSTFACTGSSPQLAFKAPARSTQSRLRITSASRIRRRPRRSGCCRRRALQPVRDGKPAPVLASVRTIAPSASASWTRRCQSASPRRRGRPGSAAARRLPAARRPRQRGRIGRGGRAAAR